MDKNDQSLNPGTNGDVGYRINNLDVGITSNDKINKLTRRVPDQQVSLKQLTDVLSFLCSFPVVFVMFRIKINLYPLLFRLSQQR